MIELSQEETGTLHPASTPVPCHNFMGLWAWTMLQPPPLREGRVPSLKMPWTRDEAGLRCQASEPRYSISTERAQKDNTGHLGRRRPAFSR